MISDKPYNLEIEDQKEYIHVIVGGEKLTTNISAAYWNEIAEACFERDQNRILIEKDFKVSVSAVDMLQMSSHLGKLLPHHLIAFVDRHGNDDINELGKKLARNRDVIIQIFHNVADAEKWLLAN